MDAWRQLPRPRKIAVQKAWYNGWARKESVFADIRKIMPGSIGIISEGDSWFAYPRLGQTVVDHIAPQWKGRANVNLLRLSESSDTATNMMSGTQRRNLETLLKQHRGYIRLVLFSAGGNDILGDNLLPLLNRHQRGYKTASDYINMTALDAKLDEIEGAYQTLINLCNPPPKSPKIVTHVYSVPLPRPKGSEFFAGLIKKGPWIYPSLMKCNVPPEFHLSVTEIVLGKFRQRLCDLQRANSGKLLVADTYRTLDPRNKDEWYDEIHPTEIGFRRIAKVVYRKMRGVCRKLPVWRD